MYSSVSSGTHHIFFPPRLEVVAEQQNPDRFASYARDQSLLYGMLGHQAHGPAGMAFRWTGADHSDDPLFLAVFKQRRRARSFLLIDSPLEAALHITMPHLSNRLRRQRYELGYARRTDALPQLQQRHGAQYRPHRLNATAQHLLEFSLILLRDLNTQSGAGHTLSMRQNISKWNCFIRIFS